MPTGQLKLARDPMKIKLNPETPAFSLLDPHPVPLVAVLDRGRAHGGSEALQVALRFGSHIDVLHVRFDVHGTTISTPDYVR
jgi:hypothetical protein